VTEVRHLVITGLVQGIGFRYSMAVQARALGVGGWVRNRRDGSVEALVAGTDEQVATMIAWSRRGPAGARVDHVAVELGGGLIEGSTEFEQLPTA
jgi:acylphosphatase